MMVAQGEYRLAGLLQVGDTVYLAQDGKLDAAKIQSVRRIAAKRPAYNLLVSPGRNVRHSGNRCSQQGVFFAG